MNHLIKHNHVPAEAMELTMESISINEEALSAIARLSDGGLRDALQLLGQASLLDVDITAHHVMEIVGGVTEAELIAILQAISTNNTFNLLQVARVLVDSGKTPKLIISNLLQTYRDLLIIKSAPKEEALLTGCVSYNQLKAFAKHWNFETLNLSLAELQKAENYLRYTVNAAVWLEVCLLNLLPGLLPGGATKTVNVKPGHDGKLLPTYGTYTINKVTDKPVDDPGKDSLLPAVAANTANASNTANLAQIWQQVMDKAKPNHQKLLAHANLVKLQGSKAILEVTPAYLQKFENSKEAIAKMLQRATQSPKPLTVLIKTANLSNNGRVRG
jgi:DNA polymerase-3 subunit gamma/tau